MEGEPLFSWFLLYCIKSGDKRLRHTIWRKSWCFAKRFSYAKKYEFCQIVLSFAKRYYLINAKTMR